MAKRYSGGVTVTLSVDDHGVYKGTVSAPDVKTYRFRMRASPEAARKYASDSDNMYTLMAKSAIAFAGDDNNDFYSHTAHVPATGEIAVMRSIEEKAKNPRRVRQVVQRTIATASPETVAWDGALGWTTVGEIRKRNLIAGAAEGSELYGDDDMEGPRKKNPRRGKLRVVEDGYVCHDCKFMIANGEIGPDTSGARLAEVAKATAGWTLDDSPEHPEHEFSSSPCRTCRSRLGGSRMWAVKLGYKKA
jgi:hypothetical protein